MWGYGCRVGWGVFSAPGEEPEERMWWLSDMEGPIMPLGGLWHTSVRGTCPSMAAISIVSFQGVIADLKLRGDPRAAERQCEEEEDDTEEVSAGSPAGAGWGLLPRASRSPLTSLLWANAGLWRFRQWSRRWTPALRERQGELVPTNVTLSGRTPRF